MRKKVKMRKMNQSKKSFLPSLLSQLKLLLPQQSQQHKLPLPSQLLLNSRLLRRRSRSLHLRLPLLQLLR
jgi:hypothetical protein